ncbi:MAG: hypothetical protein ABIC95_01505 [archaeon]
MPKPIPIWERWKNSASRTERMYIILWIGMMAVNVAIALGFIAFIIFYVRSRG